MIKIAREWIGSLVSKSLASTVAANHLLRRVSITERPQNLNIYNEPQEPSWYAIVPHNDGRAECLISSRILIISKKSGELLYDGSAGDEG